MLFCLKFSERFRNKAVKLVGITNFCSVAKWWAVHRYILQSSLTVGFSHFGPKRSLVTFLKKPDVEMFAVLRSVSTTNRSSSVWLIGPNCHAHEKNHFPSLDIHSHRALYIYILICTWHFRFIYKYRVCVCMYLWIMIRFGGIVFFQ